MKPAIAPDKIIALLAENPSKTRYDIAQVLGISYSRVHESVKALQAENAIQGKKVGKTRAGFDKVVYSLTLRGLAYLFNQYCLRALSEVKDRTLLEKADKAVKNYETLAPAVARMWDLLKRRRIREHVIFDCINLLYDVSSGEYEEITFIEFLEDLLNYPQEFFKVVEAFVESPKFYFIVKKHLEYLLKDYSRSAIVVRKGLRIFKNHAPPSREKKQRGCEKEL
jgi:DNA-binding MarR family transcriptional regulator